jgi:hypothetical protein
MTATWRRSPKAANTPSVMELVSELEGDDDDEEE